MFQYGPLYTIKFLLKLRLLELFGFAGVKTLNKYYGLKTHKKFENLNVISKNNLSEKYPYCPIELGIYFLDQILLMPYLYYWRVV